MAAERCQHPIPERVEAFGGRHVLGLRAFDLGQQSGLMRISHRVAAVRFEPGQSRDVLLVPYAGARLVYGFHQAVMGQLPAVQSK